MGGAAGVTTAGAATEKAAGTRLQRSTTTGDERLSSGGGSPIFSDIIVTPPEMRAIEDAVFADGVQAEALMDAVGRRIADHLRGMVPPFGATLLIYAGKGNNAGDALVAAKALGPPDVFFEIRLRLAQDDPAALGELARKKLDDLSP